jgi:hypothetical protein
LLLYVVIPSFLKSITVTLLALEQLKLHTLQKRRDHLDALLLTQVYRVSKFCPSELETVGVEFLLGISEIFLYPLLVKLVLLLDALQLLVLFVGT